MGPQQAVGDDWLAGIAPGTEMGARVRAFDWASTPLGPVESWSTGLRTAVRTCLASDFGMLVLWGPELVKIYNDRYRELLGAEKHPGALGRPVREVWPEIWDEIGPMIRAVVDTQVPTFDHHGRLVVERNGYAEEAYFTWSYSALYDDDGSVGGVLDVVVETTDQVLAERRLSAVTALGRELLRAEGVIDACLAATRALGRWPADIRAADIYLRIGDEIPLIASNRRFEAAPLPASVLAEVSVGREPVVIGQAIAPDGPAAHVAVPLGRSDDGPLGVLVASLSREVPLNEGFRLFLDLVSTTIGAALDNAVRRDRELGEHRAINETLQAAMITPITDTGTIAARYVSAVDNLSVGGDWYDLVELDDHRRALIVGDCVGHGLEAATAMGQLRSASRAMLLEGRDPASVLEGLDVFAGSVEGAYCATVVCALIDRRTGVITYSRAGHPPPLVSGTDGARWLEDGLSVPLAVIDGLERRNATASMNREDVLVLYSDGLVERRDESIDDGLARLAATVERGDDESVAELADRLLREMLSDGSNDDVVVVVKCLHG
jgi:GAF domain-containing protein